MPQVIDYKTPEADTLTLKVAKYKEEVFFDSLLKTEKISYLQYATRA